MTWIISPSETKLALRSHAIAVGIDVESMRLPSCLLIKP